MNKNEWPAMAGYCERNNVPDDVLGDNPIQFLRDMSISSGPSFNPQEQGEYIQFLEAKNKVSLEIAMAAYNSDKRIEKLRAALVLIQSVIGTAGYEEGEEIIDGVRLVVQNALAKDSLALLQFPLRTLRVHRLKGD